MKKVIATVVSALAALSFAGIVMAADMPAGGDTSSSTNATAGQPAAKGSEQAKPAKEHKKTKKHHKKGHKKSMKKETAPASGSQGQAVPETPAAPAAK